MWSTHPKESLCCFEIYDLCRQVGDVIKERLIFPVIHELQMKLNTQAFLLMAINSFIKLNTKVKIKYQN